VLKAIIDQKPGLKGIAFDSSQRALDDAKKLGIEGHLLDLTTPGALSNIPVCDYYIVLEVLEHVPNSEEVLRALVNKCTRSVFFSVPNTGFFRHRLRLLFGKAPAQWVTMPNEHLRFWTIRDMRWWLTALGYTKFTIIPYHGVPGLNRLMPNLFAEGMIVSVEK
jgi:2-polyprenyl-3-methyl-5-hydroxy-6-metoxy-1,4-benzoquinol methylase